MTHTTSHILSTYARYPITLERGEGSYVWDAEGKRYVDFVAGIAVLSLGHCPPALVQALSEQAHQLWHVSNLYHHDAGERAAAALAQATGFDRFFFSNSGAEANEGLFKLARRHGQLRLGGRTAVLALEQSFHGRTTAAMRLTGQARIHDGFGPLVPDVHHVAANDLRALRVAFERYRPCAVLAEPLMAEGGGVPLTPQYVQAMRALCDEYHALLIFDEVQTGVGRLGDFLGHSALGVQADAISLAKGLAGGFPAGAFGVRAQHAELLGPGTHASTFGGGLLAARLIEQVVTTVARPAFLAEVHHKGALVEQAITRWQKEGLVSYAAGRGLWWILEPGRTAAEVEHAARAAGLLVLPTQGTRLRLLPALNIGDDVLHEGLHILGQALGVK